ncbi:hypothetical protein G7085_08160 [Tessaracoccus sp. HDW20]|uniref:hypothetical protein n=1 Tax=Tessaracoccus coleopterorum TaxID=2714950 RepID=UPI0018D3889E|nr:hypothetical protein [Tessaracoccus coleopterorum]NHB84596.1 hypothetical protein [Tessaracoccus coleopterorum]
MDPDDRDRPHGRPRRGLVPRAAHCDLDLGDLAEHAQEPCPSGSAGGAAASLTYSERDEIILSLHSQGEVAAIKRYRELTGADLYTATMTVRAINRELGS